MTETVYIIVLFWICALWGSFAYTLAFRYISGEISKDFKKALFSRSKCPSCGKTISALFLVPVIGYFLTGMKCRSCRERISLWYPVWEVIFALMGVATYYHMGHTLYALHVYLFISFALVVSIVDMKTMTIPGSLLIVMLIISIYPILSDGKVLDNLYGFLFLSGVFLVIMLIFPGAFGGGDLKFAAVIGLFTGMGPAVVVLETSLITGSIVGIIYVVKTRKGFRTVMAFGPFLAIGLIVALFYGNDILLLYNRLFY